MNEELIINMAVSVVLSTIKNPAKKASLKKVMLKVFTSIKAAYADDPDFA